MKRLALGLLLGMMSLGVIGCSSATNDNIADKDIAVEQSQELTKNKQKEDTNKKEQRIIASSVAVVELLDKLEVDMVGVPTSSYELPERVTDVTRIGNPMQPDMEIVKSLDPTMVISVDTLSPDLKGSFEKLNIPVHFLNLTTYEGLKASIEELGTLFGKEDISKALIEDFSSREAAIASKMEGKEAPSVMVIFGAPGTFMIATENSYVGNLVQNVGGKNIIEDQAAGFIPVDMEYLANEQPDIILRMTHAEPETAKTMFDEEFSTNQVWQHFDAVKEGNVYDLPIGYFGMSANLLAIDAMEYLTDLFYE